MNVINFEDISSILSNLRIKSSYLTAEEINEILNFPIKEEDKTEFSLKDIIINNKICLVVLIPNKSKKSQFGSIKQILNSINNLSYIELFKINKKRSAVLSGLGQVPCRKGDKYKYDKDFCKLKAMKKLSNFYTF